MRLLSNEVNNLELTYLSESKNIDLNFSHSLGLNKDNHAAQAPGFGNVKLAQMKSSFHRYWVVLGYCAFSLILVVKLFVQILHGILVLNRRSPIYHALGNIFERGINSGKDGHLISAATQTTGTR